MALPWEGGGIIQPQSCELSLLDEQDTTCVSWLKRGRQVQGRWKNREDNYSPNQSAVSRLR